MNKYLFIITDANGEGNGTPLQYSCLENPMGGGAWWAAIRGVAKSWTRLSDFTFTFHFHALEKEMATHSSVLAWRIPGTGEHGELPSMGLHRVGHDWSNLAAAGGLKRKGLKGSKTEKQLVGSCCIMQRAQLGALWRPRGIGWEGGVGKLKRDGYIYMLHIYVYI